MAKSTTRSTSTKSTSSASKTSRAAAVKSAAQVGAAKTVSSAVKAASEAPTPADVKKTTIVDGVADTLNLDTDDENASGGTAMRKKELVDAVVARSGIKKRDAKPAVEAALAILGETLIAGRALNLPPLGKMKVQNSKELHDATVLNVRMRRKASMDDENESDADSGDDAENGDTALAEPAE